MTTHTERCDVLPHPLTRSADDRWVAGVCGGLSRWLGWRPLPVRLVVATLVLLSVVVPGLLAYLVAWWLMPADTTVGGAGAPPATPQSARTTRDS